MQVESNCRAEVTSHKGAVGLMQVIPATALSVGISDLSRPSQNIQAAAKYIKYLQSSVGENLDLVLAAYHAGPTVLKVHRGVPPFKATKEYVSKVRGIYQKLRGTPASVKL
jgi:soluble lytic murein transglycosylase-like protein